jgi:hypothetical protein
MYEFAGNLGKFGYPAVYEISIRIVFRALGVWIENTEVWSSIGDRARRPLPTAIIGSRITVY